MHPSPPHASTSTSTLPAPVPFLKRPSLADEEARMKKRARAHHPEPSDPFLSAQPLSLDAISDSTPPSEKHYVTGKVAVVRQWTEERQEVSIYIVPASTDVASPLPAPLKILLRAPDWPSAMPRPDLHATLDVLLKGLKWEPASGIGGTRRYAAVFEEGVVMRVKGRKVWDGFGVKKQMEARKQAEKGANGEGETGGREEGETSRLSDANQAQKALANHPGPPPAIFETLPRTPFAAALPEPPVPSAAPARRVSPRPRCPSPQVGPSAERVQYSGVPAFTSVDAALRIVAVTPNLPQDSSFVEPPPSVTLPLPSPIPDPAVAQAPPPPPPEPAVITEPPSPPPPMRLTIIEHILRVDAALQQDEDRLERIVDALVELPSSEWKELVLSDEVFGERVANIRAALFSQEEVEAMEAVEADMDEATAEEHAKEEVEEDPSVQYGFETQSPRRRYLPLSSVKELPVPSDASCFGIVSKIVGPTKSSKDYYMIITMQDSTGEINLKLFEPGERHLPLGLRVNDLLMVRDIAVKKFIAKKELVGARSLPHSWAYFSSDLTSLVVQPNRVAVTHDLADIAKVDPAIMSYAKKLSRWVRSLDEPLEPKLAGRFTRRVEEIKDTFFDCAVQIVKHEGKDIYVTDFTSNSLVQEYPASFEIAPTEPFGQYTLKISLWNDLAEDDLSSLRPGRFVKLHNVKPWVRESGWLEGSMFNKNGGRIERLRSSDPSVVELLRRRELHGQKVIRAPSPRTETPAEVLPSPPPAPVVAPSPPAPAVVAPEPMEVEAPVLPPNAEAGPSRLTADVPAPSRKGKERERHASVPVAQASGRARFETDSLEMMVDRFGNEASPTQALFYDLDHPNGSSLRNILASDRAKFRTRARILDFAPRALEDVVVATCERCEIDLPSSDKRCRACCDLNGDYTVWRYRLVLSLTDGTATIIAAVFDEKDMLTLFPHLPPASEFQHSPTNPMDYLEAQLLKLAGKTVVKGDDASTPGPLLDLALRKFRVRIEGRERFSYRVFATVMT